MFQAKLANKVQAGIRLMVNTFGRPCIVDPVSNPGTTFQSQCAVDKGSEYNGSPVTVSQSTAVLTFLVELNENDIVRFGDGSYRIDSVEPIFVNAKAVAYRCSASMLGGSDV